MRNAEPTKQDWELLMNHTNKSLCIDEQKEFDQSMHLYSTNDLVRIRNRKMLKTTKSSSCT